MKALAVDEHHGNPGVTGLAGWLKVLEGKGERGREAGVLGEPPGEGIVLAFIRDDHRDFLFSDQGEQIGEVMGGRVSRFGRPPGENRSGDRQAVVIGKQVEVGVMGNKDALLGFDRAEKLT